MEPMSHTSVDNAAVGLQARDDEISLLEIATAILRHWRPIVVLPPILALAVGLSSLVQDRAYAASASFMPQGTEARPAGVASALAQQFGVSLGSDRPGHSPQFYVDLLRNPAVLRKAAESEYTVVRDDGRVVSATLIELYNIPAGAKPVPAWRAAADRLRNNVSASVVRETGVIQLTVLSSSPALAEQIAERLLGLLDEFNTDVRQSRAQEESRFVGSRLEEAETDLLAAEGAIKEFLRNNREFRNSPELVFEHDRLQRQVAMRQEIFTSLLRSQEQARIDAVRDTPLFTMIEHPAGTAEPRPRHTVRRAIMAFMFGLMIALFAAFVAEFSRRSRRVEDPRYRELEGLARQAWADVRHPRRWLRRGRKPVAAGGGAENGS
jgi:uncharacterized protein involved in exopolysaccharide biosynthesis